MTEKRLESAFSHGRPALVTYVMAGYPDRESSLAARHALAAGGSDLIELGVPYADPLADGPVIRDAAEQARAANGGFGLEQTIELAAEFIAQAAEKAPPVALMTYLNPLMRMGMPIAVKRMSAAGISGVIVPDLPPDMAAPWLSAASEKIDTVFLAAPTSTPERLAKVGEKSSGFVYCVSTTGVTGERSELPSELTDLVARVRAHTSLPVAVGFGVSTIDQAREVSRIADGVVVGSALVRRQNDAGELAAFVQQLASVVHADL